VISINQQITLISNKIRVLKSLKGVQMIDVAAERLPVYEAILKTLKGVKKDENK
tara:strand:+ start:2154 stop:2315 length:162 start_codon:yes stop_codon:yes gene_type:complete